MRHDSGSKIIYHSFSAQRNAAKLAMFDELVEVCEKLTPILEAMRYSVGLGKNQLERIEKAKALLARARELR